MYKEEIEDMTKDDELTNRIEETETELWSDVETVRNAIKECISNEVGSDLMKGNGDSTGKQITEFVMLGDKLLSDVRNHIRADSVTIETGVKRD